jgi:D-threo-aldose 1-dehydrogenase
MIRARTRRCPRPGSSALPEGVRDVAEEGARGCQQPLRPDWLAGASHVQYAFPATNLSRAGLAVVSKGAVLETRDLAGGVLTTTALGLGCAELFSLPSRSDRAALLHAAYELGIRHFDVAPMYGLGAAERELGRFVRERRDTVTIATKFGIVPSGVGRAARAVQPPIRAVLSRAPALKAELKSSGKGPASGAAGRLLYRHTGYSTKAARASLERSLRVMDLDHVDVFLLHEPVTAQLMEAEDLAEYLQGERRAGRISAWGPAGDLDQIEAGQAARSLGCQVIQRRDDLLMERRPNGESCGYSEITFGVLSRALPLIRTRAVREPEFARRLRKDWGLDVNGPDLVGVLLREALRRNRSGLVLYSTTRIRHLRSAVEGVQASPDSRETDLVQTLRAAVAETAGVGRGGE